MFNRSMCTGCGACVAVCPVHANRRSESDALIDLDRSLCTGCGQCISACIQKARKRVGTPYTVEQVMSEVLKDRALYRNSDGGVTISGGDPVSQAAFVQELLKACNDELIHTAIETSGYLAPDRFEQMIRYADYVFFDLKQIDSNRHQDGTGVGNEVILENAARLTASGKDFMFRIPLIPGFNDSPADITAVCDFLRKWGVTGERVELLKYNQLGEDKYIHIGRSKKPSYQPQSQEHMDILQAIVDQL